MTSDRPVNEQLSGGWWKTNRCEVVKRSEAGDMRCMRPKGHEGKHRGSRMVPETVWFDDEGNR